MPLIIASLNSGSNGNCYYIGNKHDAVFVDAGLSCRETERRMDRLGLDIQNVRAIVVSHEHSDHIKGVPVIAKKYKLPVFITHRTLQRSKMHVQNAVSFSAGNTFSIESLSVRAFPKFHDACDPHSFTVSYGSTQVGVFTDIGVPCAHVIAHFQKCHAAFLEANYDEELLEKGRYPIFLKNRIRGGKGHLSNRQAVNLFKKYKPPYMSHLLLSHLSADNNHPDLVSQLFHPYTENTTIVVASRYQETSVYEVGTED